MLKDIIGISKGFQSSVNIEYDFNDKDKITGFIPTRSALEIINNIISNTNDSSTERAKILTGAYGRGKSHIVLVALSILFNKNKQLFKTLLDKVKKIDEDDYKIINNYISSKKRLLPVIINGNSGNLTQAFLNALEKALRVYEIEDIMPETHFQAAINKLDLWKKDYKDVYERFKAIIGQNIDTFINELKSNSSKTYQKFIEVYPKLTAGSEFNPFVGFNVVDIYDNVNSALKLKGYSGMVVVYDEFGKYLESSIVTASESETKMLQDFAERCNRPASQQLHLLMICHKDISNYIDGNLSQDKVDGWRGISGRFEHINLSNNFSQMYEIIADAIIRKDRVYDEFVNENRKVFEEMVEVYRENRLLLGKEELVVYNCFPLHPSTTFLLPRLSEKIAQNERTLFTFLTSTHKNTLREFVKNDTSKFSMLTPDYLYDYFENELKKELNSSEIHHIYTLSAKILQSLEEVSLSSKIIKAIAVVYFVQQFESMAPTIETICEMFSFQYDSKDIIDEINALITKAFIVYKKRSNNYLCLKETSGVDVNEEIKNRAEKIKNIKSLSEVLNQYSKSRFLYPNQHNDKNCITRYFDFKFVSRNGLENEISKDIPDEVAGRVYAVFYDNFVDFENDDVFCNNNFERAILIFPKQFQDIFDCAYEYYAIQELKQECIAEDRVLFDEYSMYADDYYSVIDDFILSYTRPELNKSKYYFRNNELQIVRKSQLSNELSKICNELYTLTPVINNETLNKDTLTSAAINSRTKLINAILESGNIEENLGLKGSGQDVSFMRSALIRTGILVEKNGIYDLTLNSDNDSNISYVLKVIKDFFDSTISEGEQNFEKLYIRLTNVAYHIGMKKGVIPIFVAVVLTKVKNNIVIKCNGDEIKLTADLLNSINEKPNCYTVMMENWNEAKTNYLNGLESIFSDYLYEKDKTYNAFAYIFNAINRWYLFLPKCAREMIVDYATGERVKKSCVKFLNSLKGQIVNYRDYVMEKIPLIFGYSEINDELVADIFKTKRFFDLAKKNLTNYLLSQTIEIFNGNPDASVNTVLSDWYISLNDITIQNIFPNNENALLRSIANINNDEESFVEGFAMLLTGLKINDWGSKTSETYKSNLYKFKTTIDDFDANADKLNEKSSGTRYSIGFVGDNGEEEFKLFEKVEISPKAKLLYNDITGAIEDMGQSITENEKRQVLLKILEELCM